MSKEANDDTCCGYTRAVDWWAVGVVLYEMLVGRLPFSSENDQGNKVLFEKILNDKVKMPLDLSNDSKSILWQLLEKKPSKRLGSSVDGFNEIKTHSFFSSIEWQKLMEKKLEPPFRPLVDSDSDTCYFEKEFTGENVQLTPSEEASPLLSNVNYFDSFSFYGSKNSLNSQKSNSTRSSSQNVLDENKSDKFDTTSLTQSSANFTSHLNTSENFVFSQSKFSYHLPSTHNKNRLLMHENSNDTWRMLASSAFPNIIPSTIYSSESKRIIHSSSSSSTSADSDEKMDT